MVTDETLAQARGKWQGMGLSGGGAMFTPAISPLDPNLMMLNCDMSCAFRTDDGGRNWEMIHHHYLIASTQCRPVFHPTDPNTVFAVNGYGGELRVSHDRGVTWRPVSDALPRGVLRIAIDPAGGDLMLVGCYRGDLSSVSHDAGKTWARSSGLKGAVVGFHIDQTSPPGKRRCFAGTTEGVFVSDDAGATWRPIGDGLPDRGMLEFTGGSNASDGCVLYCTTQSEIAGGNFAGGVYRSTDGGRTWQQAMGAGIDTEGRQRWGAMRAPQYPFVLTTNVHPRTVYAVREAPGQVFRSDDAGDSWRPLLFVRLNDERFNTEPSYLTAETGGWEENMSGAGINPADPDTVILTDWMCCQITHDGGKTWQTLHSRPAPGQGPVGKGQRWENTGLTVTTIWHYYFDPFEKDRRYIAYTDIGYAWSDDAGKTWRWLHGRPLRNTTYEIAFDPDTPGKMWAAFSDVHDIPNANIILERHGTHGQGGVGVSEDFGVTWRDTSEGLPGSCVISVVLDPRSPKGRRTLYASVWEHGVYKSVDDGATWTSRSAGLGAPGVNMRTCRLILHPDGTLFCLVTALREGGVWHQDGVGLYRSRDGGDTWEWINRSLPLTWPKDFDVDPRDSRVIYLGAADADGRQEGGLYKTTDGGAAWRRIAREGPDTFGATVDPRDPDRVYMCLVEGAPGPGLWLSKDAGETWKPFWGLPFRNVQRIAFEPDDPSVIYACTFGGGLWKGPAEE